MQQLVNMLIDKNKTIATMESCTGGALANEITNVSDASKVIKFSAVTYSNEFKIKMGVDSSIIDKYTVYSIQTAKEMSKVISDYANADYGVGITGKMNKPDENNMWGSDNLVYVSIYDRNKDIYYTLTVEVLSQPRKENKQLVVSKICDFLKKVV